MTVTAHGTDAAPTRVLVTGATGFLGGHVLAALAARDDVTIIAACRTPGRLPAGFAGEARVGDLTDPAYRREVVRGVDVVVHAGTWGAFWGHADAERRLFHEPAVDLVEQAITADVRRFLMASTVAIGTPSRDGTPVDDDSPTVRTGFWPHLDLLVDLDDHMQANAHRGTQLVTMRLGHFVGPGGGLGLVQALAPRLRTRLVPWIDGGRAHVPLVSGTDMGRAFSLAATADGLRDHESFNIVGADVPTARDVIAHVAELAGVPAPRISVPTWAGHAFGWLMERLHPVLPGKAPFLTRSIVHVAQDWNAAADKARRVLGYEPASDWREEVRATLAAAGPRPAWPSLAQAVT